MNHRSLGFQLSAWYACVLALTLAATGIGLRLALGAGIHSTVDKDLRARAAVLRQAVAPTGGPLTRNVLETAAADAGLPWRIADSRGVWLFQSPEARTWGVAPLPPPRLDRFATITEGRRTVRVLTAPWAGGTLQIGMATDEFAEMLDDFTWTALLASPLLLLLASIGGFWMSRRALAPVEEIVRAAGDIEARNLSERLPVRGTGDELDRLAATVNAMLARLESAFARMRQFTADASHELRTPVSVMRTTAEVTLRRPRGIPEYESALARIQAASERSSGLIEQLMLLARADAAAESPALEPVALQDLALQACAEARVLAEAAGVRLHCNCPHPFSTAGDAPALRRLLLILLDNAIKYSHPGGEVSLSLQRLADPARPSVRFEVRDQGMGIAAEHLPHLFERFYRAAPDRSRDHGGAGLGLAIAQVIARQHHGDLSLASHPGQGTTACLVLPLLAS
jgi:heavy metal sensor kinase